MISGLTLAPLEGEETPWEHSRGGRITRALAPLEGEEIAQEHSQAQCADSFLGHFFLKLWGAFSTHAASILLQKLSKQKDWSNPGNSSQAFTLHWSTSTPIKLLLSPCLRYALSSKLFWKNHNSPISDFTFFYLNLAICWTFAFTSLSAVCVLLS